MGRTATNWTWKALNCHKDVFFEHGYDLEPNKFRKETDLEKGTRMAKFKSQLVEFVSQDNPHDVFFDLVERSGSFGCYGTIHSLLPIFRPDQELRRDYIKWGCG